MCHMLYNSNMWNKLLKFFEFSSKNGIYLPNAFDNDKAGPSVTLLFAHFANLLALFSIIYLTYTDPKYGTAAAITYSVITMILYMMRRITKFKVDIDDGELEAENSSTEDNNNVKPD